MSLPFHGVGRRTVGFGMGIALLAGGISGCSADAMEVGPHPMPHAEISASPEAVAKAYMDLGIVGVSATVVSDMGIPLGDLAKDATRRDYLVNDKPTDQAIKDANSDDTKQQKAIDSPGESPRIGPDLDYDIPVDPAAAKGGDINYWTYKTPPPGPSNFSATFLPLAVVKLDNKGQLIATDLRPPKARMASRVQEGMPDNFTDLLDNVIRPEQYVMRSALGKRSVKRYIFGYDSAFQAPADATSSFADPESRDIVNYLTVEETETHQTERVTLDHETDHALMFDNAASGTNKELDNSSEMQNLRQACKAIRDDLINYVITYHRQDVINGLNQLRNKVPAANKADVDGLISDFEADDIGQVQTNNDFVSGYSDAPECTIQKPSDMLTTQEINDGTYINRKEIPSAEKEASNAVDTVFSDALRDNVLHKTLNEHGYVDDPRFGHIEGGEDEVFASIRNIAENFHEEFMDYLNQLPYDEARDAASMYLAVKALYAKADPVSAKTMPDLDFSRWGFPAPATELATASSS